MTQVVSADGTRIAVDRSGSGTPLVLVHGSATDARQWDGLRALLPERYEVFAMDRRGRRDSGDGPHSFKAEGEDIRAVLDLAGPEAIVLGHSFGARCTIEALVAGAQVARAILYEPMLSTGVEQMDFDAASVDELEALERAGDADAAMRFFIGHITRTPDAALDRLAQTPMWRLGLDSCGTLAAETRSSLDDAIGAEELARVSVPVRLLVGERTMPHFVTAAHRYAEFLPSAEIVTLPGMGHLAVELSPAAVLTAAAL